MRSCGSISKAEGRKKVARGPEGTFYIIGHFGRIPTYFRHTTRRAGTVFYRSFMGKLRTILPRPGPVDHRELNHSNKKR